MSGSARNGSTHTREERLEWARKVRDFKISTVFYPKDREEQIAALQVLKGDDLLALTPEPKWYGDWDNLKLTWETVARHSGAELILDRGKLGGRVISEVLQASDPAVLRLEGGFAAFGHLSYEASATSLLRWGVISQEQFVEITTERTAANEDMWTRNWLRLEIGTRLQSLAQQHESLTSELKAYQDRLANADQLTSEELGEIVKKMASIKGSIEELDLLRQQEEALAKTYRHPKGTQT